MSDLVLTAADERAHEAGEERLWGESWYFDFTDRAGTLGGYVRLGLYPNLGVAWYWACLVGEGRPLVTVIDHEVALPKAPSPRDPGRRALGRPHRRDAVRALQPRLRGLRGRRRRPGRGLRRPPRRPGAVRARPRVGDRRDGVPVDRHHPLRDARATCTARSSWATRPSPSTGSASATTAGASATGGASAGSGRPAASRTAPASTPPASGCPGSRPSPPATCSLPAACPSRSRSCAAEEELDAQRVPDHGLRRVRAARHGHRAGGLLARSTSSTTTAPAPGWPGSPGRCAGSRTTDGRNGVGWTEWNQPT